MQEFRIEVGSPAKIILTDNEYFEERAVIVVKPHEHERGFDIFVESVTDRVHLYNDYAD